MEELGLMERFADPALFDSLTFGEKVAGGLVTTLMGMGTTFVILILLWWIIAAMAKIMKTGAPKKEKPVKAVQVPLEKSDAASAAASVPASETGSGAETVAVIMAAIAAYEGTDYVNNLIIRRINRLSGNRTAWSAAGSADCIESRKF